MFFSGSPSSRQKQAIKNCTCRRTQTQTTDALPFTSLIFVISFFSYHVVINWPTFSVMPLAWAINTAATASYKAVPSMFTVAPSGRTKRVIRASTLLCSSRQRIVVGRVAELRKIKMALEYFFHNFNSF